MKAIVQDRYGSTDVLELRDIGQPVPEDNGALIRVPTAALHRGDWLSQLRQALTPQGTLVIVDGSKGQDGGWEASIAAFGPPCYHGS